MTTYKIYLSLIFFLISQPALSLSCEVQMQEKYYWFEFIVFDRDELAVTLTTSEDYGSESFRLDLIVDPNHQDVFKFNMYPTSPAAGGVTMYFKFFRILESWNLIGAGLERIGNINTLKALDTVTRYIVENETNKDQQRTICYSQRTWATTRTIA